MPKSSLKIFVLLILLTITSEIYAANRYLVISGGGSPAGNHHSQYLQGKTLAQYLQQRFGPQNVDIYFAVGNSEKNPKIYPDVHATVKEKGLFVDKMLYGIIPHNKPATKKNITHYFNSKKVDALSQNDTLFLFVGDHGMPNKKSDYYDNNCIDLWNYDVQKMETGSWKNTCLSTKELKKLITKRVKAARTVFVMSQCYSGGFLQMAVADKDGYPTANPNLCGFTAVTEDLPSSGCTAFVSEHNYRGYERYFTEKLTGINVISGTPMSYKHKRTIQEAHYAASLIDMTVDIPTTTSEYYLQQWYDTLIDDDFEPRTKKLTADKIHQILDNITSLNWNHNTILAHVGTFKPIIQELILYMDQLTNAIVRESPDLREILTKWTEKQIKAHTDKIDNELKDLNKKYGKLNKEYGKLRYEQLFTPWYQAVQNNKVKALTEDEREIFELDFFANYENDYKGSTKISSALNREFILALADSTKDDPELAKDFAHYASQRDNKISQWAKKFGSSNTKEALKKLTNINSKLVVLNKQIDKLDRKKIYIRRILRFRQQLAAAIDLVLMDDQIAIAELKGLLECEKTRF